jgi:SWI/SNF-related matrix-associated actin-dependent regulator 1 of chromatin subfamily A
MEKSLRRFDWDTKQWEVHYTAADAALDNLRKLWPNAQIDGSIGKRAQELAKAEELATATQVDERDEIVLPNSDLRPYPYQCAAIRFLEIRDSAMIADEMGLGKTACYLATLARNPDERMPALVICPAAVKLNWGREAHRWVNGGLKIVAIFPKQVKEVLPNGRLGKIHCDTKDLPQNMPDIAIINYDIINRLKDTLMACCWKSVCNDESHALKEYKSARTKAAVEICKNIKYRVLLTGTPMPNRPRELWTQLHIMDPARYKRFSSFGKKYCAPEMTRWGMNWNGASNLDELNEEIIGKLVVRRKLADVIDDMPEKRVVRQLIDPDPTGWKEYRTAEQDFINWARSQGAKKLHNAQKAEAIMRLTTLRHLSAKCKVEALTEMAGDFLRSTERQLVIFAHHREVTETLVKELSTEFKVGHIIGGIGANKRQEMINRWKAGELNVMICSIKAAGTGTDGLQETCHDAWIVERDWTPAGMDQTESRLHRLGQKEKVCITYFDIEQGIDGHMAELIKSKSQIIDKVVDGKDVSEQEDESYATQIVARMLDNQ